MTTEVAYYQPRPTLPSVAHATLTFVRDLDPEELETLAGNPLRQMSDRDLWHYLTRVIDPERLGMLIAEGVHKADRLGVVLQLDGLVVQAWSTYAEWLDTWDDAPALRELGEAATAGGA